MTPFDPVGVFIQGLTFLAFAVGVTAFLVSGIFAALGIGAAEKWYMKLLCALWSIFVFAMLAGTFAWVAANTHMRS